MILNKYTKTSQNKLLSHTKTPKLGKIQEIYLNGNFVRVPPVKYLRYGGGGGIAWSYVGLHTKKHVIMLSKS